MGARMPWRDCGAPFPLEFGNSQRAYFQAKVLPNMQKHVWLIIFTIAIVECE